MEIEITVSQFKEIQDEINRLKLLQQEVNNSWSYIGIGENIEELKEILETKKIIL